MGYLAPFNSVHPQDTAGRQALPAISEPRAALTCTHVTLRCPLPVLPLPPRAADKFLCNQASTRQRMVQYANDQAFFFAKYADAFQKLGALGYGPNDLRVLV